jgi:hypothetical protein
MDMPLPVLLGAIPVVGLLAYLWLQARANSRLDRATTRCPRCGQKVRYSLSRAGHVSTCPQCRESWTLPGDSKRSESLEIKEVYRVRRR